MVRQIVGLNKKWSLPIALLMVSALVIGYSANLYAGCKKCEGTNQTFEEGSDGVMTCEWRPGYYVPGVGDFPAGCKWTEVTGECTSDEVTGDAPSCADGGNNLTCCLTSPTHNGFTREWGDYHELGTCTEDPGNPETCVVTGGTWDGLCIETPNEFTTIACKSPCTQ